MQVILLACVQQGIVNRENWRSLSVHLIGNLNYYSASSPWSPGIRVIARDMSGLWTLSGAIFFHPHSICSRVSHREISLNSLISLTFLSYVSPPTVQRCPPPWSRCHIVLTHSSTCPTHIRLQATISFV